MANKGSRLSRRRSSTGSGMGELVFAFVRGCNLLSMLESGQREIIAEPDESLVLEPWAEPIEPLFAGLADEFRPAITIGHRGGKPLMFASI